MELRTCKESLNVWIVQTGEPVHSDKFLLRPMRAMNLANKLVENGHKVVLWTSCFFHQQKIHRFDRMNTVKLNDNLSIVYIPSPGYKRNIGFRRLFDHLILGLRFNRALKSSTLERPNLVFVGYPPIEMAYFASLWCKKRNIPLVLDIKDQWPSIFVDRVPKFLKYIVFILFSPYFYMARETIKNSKSISTISSGFLGWASRISGKKITDNDFVFPLVAPESAVSSGDLDLATDWWRAQGVDPAVRNCFSFVGSVSRAFDFTGIANAAKRLKNENANCLFIICGDGSALKEVKDMMFGLDNVIFSGWIDLPKIKALSLFTLGSLAPYVNTSDFVQSVPNKIYDSLSFGLPIITSLDGEVRAIVLNQNIGYYCPSDQQNSWYNALKDLLCKPDQYESMSNAAYGLYSSRYAFDKVYGDAVLNLERLSVHG